MKESNFHANVGQVNQTIQTKENAMSELSNLHNSRMMSSREIAELTGKEHKNVLRDINVLIEQGAITALNFERSGYRDASGKSNPEYLLDFDATMTLLATYKVSRPIVLSILSRLNNDKVVKSNTIKENVMENLPMNQNNFDMSKTMSSREIAELTGKLHKNVIQDIRNLIEQGAIDRLNFQPISYKDAYGREQIAYELNFDATMTLVTGYNAVLRAKVIRRWRELEEGVHNTQKVSSEPVQPPLLEELAVRGLKATYEMAKFFGLEGNQALLKADKAVKKLHNISPMALLEIELKSPDNEALLIATEIGKKTRPSHFGKECKSSPSRDGLSGEGRVSYRKVRVEAH